MLNSIGKGGRLFAEPKPSPDATSFQTNNTSSEYFNSPYYLQHKNQIQPIPKPLIDPPRMNLADVLQDPDIQAIQSANQITLHVVGDTGAVMPTHLTKEETVADAMAADVQAGGPTAPSFFFHLGDIVYYFGEHQYYYDQFYEPYRAYDRPIFAIPGNHDGVTYGDSSTSKAPPTLEAFLRNFCAATPGASPDSGGLMRSTMTQPGVYFTLDAPLVSIIGLYSNVLEGPGIISSQGNKYPISDEQLLFLTSELQRLKPSRMAGERAVLLAVHHPPLSVDAKHSGSTGLAQDMDTACQQAGLWPDAVFSGHAHLYQRFTRHVANQDIPYVVSGSGGYNAISSPQPIPKAPFTNGDTTLEIDPIIDYGYLKVTIDMTSSPRLLTIAFYQPKVGKNATDSVKVDLDHHQII